LKTQEPTKLTKSHNPKVGGSNPSLAIEGRLNKPPFYWSYKPYSLSLNKSGAKKSGAKLAFGGKILPKRPLNQFRRPLQIIHVSIVASREHGPSGKFLETGGELIW